MSSVMSIVEIVGIVLLVPAVQFVGSALVRAFRIRRELQATVQLKRDGVQLHLNSPEQAEQLTEALTGSQPMSS
jgi:hypothetical protein